MFSESVFLLNSSLSDHLWSLCYVAGSEQKDQGLAHIQLAFQQRAGLVDVTDT